MNYNTLTLGVGIGIVIGAVPTFFITKKIVTQSAQERADAEIAEVTERFAKLNKVGQYADPSALAQELGYVTTDTEDPTYDEAVAAEAVRVPVIEVSEADSDDVEGVEPPKLPLPSDVPQRRNLFEEAERIEANISQEEIEARSPENPYIITAEEWGDNNSPFEKITLTYYTDGTLADDHDKPVEDKGTLVGLENLQRFGTYSRDREIVYVRNEKHDAEFEIVRSDQDYIQMMNEQ
jgi:hypothetical protein